MCPRQDAICVWSSSVGAVGKDAQILCPYRLSVHLHQSGAFFCAENGSTQICEVQKSSIFNPCGNRAEYEHMISSWKIACVPFSATALLPLRC